MLCFVFLETQVVSSVSKRSPVWGFRARTGRALSSSDSVYFYHRHLWITRSSQSRTAPGAGEIDFFYFKKFDPAVSLHVDNN